MDQPNIARRLPLAEWQVETLRMTVFPSQPLQTEGVTWWADLAGEPPETSLRLPRTHGLQEEGPFGEGKLVLRVDPNRVDWVLAPRENPRAEVEGFLVVGSLPELLESFCLVISRWFDFEACPSAQRMAFGAILLRPVADYQAGLVQLADYLPFLASVRGDLSDFLYQINRRRDSGVGIPDLRINRLSKWSVMTTTLGDVTLQSHLMRLSPTRTHYACRIELDMNTVPNFSGELSRDQQLIVFQELVHLAREIVGEGDIP